MDMPKTLRCLVWLSDNSTAWILLSVPGLGVDYGKAKCYGILDIGSQALSRVGPRYSRAKGYGRIF